MVVGGTHQKNLKWISYEEELRRNKTATRWSCELENFSKGII